MAGSGLEKKPKNKPTTNNATIHVNAENADKQNQRFLRFSCPIFVLKTNSPTKAFSG
jgi:hypothetical protein